jgi:hypothetical protein
MKLRLVLLVLLGVVVAAAAFAGGRSLHSPSQASGRPAAEGVVFTPAKPIAGTSRGGFSGFGEVSGLEGKTVLAGRVVALNPGSITVETAAGVRTSVQLAGEGSLRRIESVGREALRPGATIVVRRGPGSEVAAILVLAEP